MKRARVVPEEELSPRTEALPPPWPARRVQLDGAMIQVRDTPPTAPDTEPALYVHGLGGSAQNWTDLAALLAHRLDGCAVDLPGFGYSDPSRRYTIPAFATRIVRLLEQEDRGPVHLLGNSLGGAICVRVAALRPDLIRTLTLISPAMPFLDFRRSAQSAMLPVLALPQAHRLAARYLSRSTPEQMAHEAMLACFADPSRVCEQRRREAIEEVRLRFTVPHYPMAYLGSLRGLVSSFVRSYLPGTGSLWRLAARITAPTLVIGGTADRLVDVRVPAQVARTIPDARFRMLQGVGHVAQMEVPRDVARTVLGLLDEVSAAVASSRPGRISS